MITDASPDRQHSGRLFGKYPARVRDTAPTGADPGTLLVEIPSLLEDDPGAEGLQLPSDKRETADAAAEGKRRMLALARPCLPPGYYAIPSEGDGVWVEFAAGDPRHAIWSGVWLPDGGLSDQMGGVEVGRRLFRGPGGVAVEIDESGDEPQLLITLPSGDTYVRLRPGVIELKAGSATITLADNDIVAVGEKLTAQTDGLTLDLPDRMQQWLNFTLLHTHISPAGGGPTAIPGAPPPEAWMPFHPPVAIEVPEPEDPSEDAAGAVDG